MRNMVVRCRSLVGGLLLSATIAFSAPAQGPVLGVKERTHISGWEGLAATAAIGTTFFLDRPARGFLQANRSRTLNGIADMMRPMGEPVVYGSVAGGMLVAGLVSNDDDLKRAAGRLILAEAVTLASVQLIKFISGRVRPDSTSDPFRFRPFRNRQSGFVSGHAAMAFTLATTLGDEIEQNWVDILLYTFAGGTAWSRLNDNRHWPSDVAGGALLGYAVARMAGDHWKLFGMTTPEFLQDD